MAKAQAGGKKVDLKPIADAIIGGKRDVVVELVKKALAENVAPATILNDGLIAGMNEVGRRFKANEFYVPEVLIAARAMSNAKEAATRPGAMEILQPYLTKAGVKSRGKVIIGTVKGDLHDIGKNLVLMMLRGAGFEVIDLEIDVPAEKFVETAKAKDVKLIGLSALLTTTMPQMKTVIETVRKAGLKDVKVMIGGAPVTQSYADEIGAQGYAPDAASAVDKAKELLGVA
jgi:5-methyltetrahydrofolate--homocysteine methyltransferase